MPLGPDIDFGAPYGRGARGASTVLKNTETTYGAVARGFHWLLFVLLTIAVIVGHAAAAFYHHYVMKDDVLCRMSLRPGT